MSIVVTNPARVARIQEYLKWKYVIGERGDCISRLTPAMQDRFTASKLTLEELREIAFLYQFTRGVILLIGKAGSGKTLTMTQLLYNLRKYFGMHSITDYELKAAYGAHNYLSTDEFIDHLKRLDDLVKIRKDRMTELTNKEVNERLGEAAETILKERGIVFDNAAIGWDEANRKLEASRANSRLVMIHRYYVQTWRHYQCALILATPEISDITPKALTQVTIELSCSYDRERQDCVAMGRHRDTLEPIVMHTYMPNYCQYYETHAPISIRDAVMSFRGKKL